MNIKNFLVISMLFFSEQKKTNELTLPLLQSLTPKNRTKLFIKENAHIINFQESKIRNIMFFCFFLFLSSTCLMKSFCDLNYLKIFHFIEIPGFTFFASKKKNIIYGNFCY